MSLINSVVISLLEFVLLCASMLLCSLLWVISFYLLFSYWFFSASNFWFLFIFIFYYFKSFLFFIKKLCILWYYCFGLRFILYIHSSSTNEITYLSNFIFFVIRLIKFSIKFFPLYSTTWSKCFIIYYNMWDHLLSLLKWMLRSVRLQSSTIIK